MTNVVLTYELVVPDPSPKVPIQYSTVKGTVYSTVYTVQCTVTSPVLLGLPAVHTNVHTSAVLQLWPSVAHSSRPDEVSPGVCSEAF